MLDQAESWDLGAICGTDYHGIHTFGILKLNQQEESWGPPYFVIFSAFYAFFGIDEHKTIF